MKIEKRIKKKHIDYSCGFPITLINVPEVKINNEWIIDIDYDLLARTVLQRIIYQPRSLTGSEIRFIRHYFQMTIREFSSLFHVAHTAVTKWEKYEDQAAKIIWGTELTIRLFLLDKLFNGSKQFHKSYQSLFVLDFSSENPSTELKLNMENELKTA